MVSHLLFVGTGELFRSLEARVGREAVEHALHVRGLDLGAPDDRPVTLFFLMGAEDRRHHLQILGKLARILKDDVLRDELMTVESPDDFVATFNRAEQSANRVNNP